MKRRTTLICLLTMVGLLTPSVAHSKESEPTDELRVILSQNIDLNGPRSAGTRYYQMQTTLVSISPDGTRGETETFRVKLACAAVKEAEDAGVRYTCARFDYVKPNGETVQIPALAGWGYTYHETEDGLDDKGQVFGIDHSRFENLTDSQDQPIGPDKAYFIYNTFVDFHAIVDVFAKPAKDGQGIQNLSAFGQQVVHTAADSTAPTHLGGNIMEGSFFKNGRITLTLKGLTVVDENPCALVGYDSGDSSFRMLMEPMPGMQVESVGSSHYFGDICVDLLTKWPQRADMGEFVVTQSTIPMPNTDTPMTINAAIERRTVLTSISKQVYEGD